MFGFTRRDNETSLTRPQTVGSINPWSEFNRLRSEMDSLFGSILPVPRLFDAIGNTSAFAPAVDLYETGNELVLNCYLPGISPEDVQVEVIGDTIHVAGETKPNIPEKDVTVHLSQGGWGRFDARYRLPVEVQADQVKARYNNGVLEVRLPKPAAQTPRRVEVQVGGQTEPMSLEAGSTGSTESREAGQSGRDRTTKS